MGCVGGIERMGSMLRAIGYHGRGRCREGGDLAAVERICPSLPLQEDVAKVPQAACDCTEPGAQEGSLGAAQSCWSLCEPGWPG